MQTGTINGVALPVSKLVLGAMVVSSEDIEHCYAMLDAFTEAGGNAFDVAYIYGGGTAEKGLGAWMKTRGNREKVVILGKGAHPDASGDKVNPAAIASDLSTSLERLQTDYIDLYLLHRDDVKVPVGELVDCLDAHRAAGLIRAYGGSNWTTKRIQEANEYAAANGKMPFVASSPHIGLGHVKEEMWGGCLTATKEDLAWHERHQFPALPWSSQDSGFFTGRYSPEVHDNADVERVYYSADNWKRLDRARELGLKKQATANQVALAYVMSMPFPIFPIVGPRKLTELESTLPALNVALSADERKYLNLETDRLS